MGTVRGIPSIDHLAVGTLGVLNTEPAQPTEFPAELSVLSLTANQAVENG